MKNSKKQRIVEDVIYFKQNAEGKVTNLAKDTFYYTYLMEHSNDKIDGQENKKAAEDFFAFEEIYCLLHENGLLKNPKYCIDWTEIGDYGACFTLNLEKLLEDFELERMLNDNLPGMSDYIKTFIDPAERFYCSICGALTFSRHMEFKLSNGIKETHCLSCYAVDEPIQSSIRKVYKCSNGDVIIAVKERIELIREAAKLKIAEGKTINILLDEYKQNHAVKDENKNVLHIREFLEKNHLTEWEVFESDDFDVVMWNRRGLAKEDLFSKAIALNETNDEIIMLFTTPSAIYLNEKAIAYIRILENF